MLLLSVSLQGQTVISTITPANRTPTTSSPMLTSPDDAGNSIDGLTTYTVNFGSGNDIGVTSYTLGGVVYNNFVSPDTLLLRRVSSSRLVNIWYEDSGINNTTDVITIDPTAVAEADAIYLSNTLNAGYDNILVNEDDLASGSIEVETERVDVIWYSGIQTALPAEAIFPIIERGGNDNIIVAPILSLDSNGDPASYGTAIGIGETDWPGTGQTFTDYVIFRRETVGVDPIPLLDIGSQVVQGVGVSFSDMDVAADQSIFGYSIFPADIANDFTTNTNDEITFGEISVFKAGVDLTDITTFPTNTLSSDSGLDLVAGVAAGVASTGNIIVENKGPGGYKAALSTWLKANEADDITTSTDGSTVSDWQDHWIGDHDATTGTTANPIYRSTSSAINFNPTVDFTISETSLTIANNTDFNTATSYANKGLNFAFRTGADVTTNRQVIYEQGGENRGIIVYIDGGDIHASAYNRASDGTGSPWNNGTNITTVSTTVDADTEYILTLELDGNSGTTGTLTPYLNGASFGTLSNVGLLFSDTDGIEFGGSDGSTQYDNGTDVSANSFRGEISEFIYCNEPGSFTTAQRDRIESYLAIKYGITLDQAIANDYVNSAGTVIFDATNDETAGGFKQYNNDIAGIGRDDDSELDQPKSRSENSDGRVIVDRGATIGTDDAWLIWGNDDGALTETTMLTMPDTIDSRLTRVWRVAEEKEVQTTSVSFDLASLGLSSDEADFSLLIAGSNAVTVSGNAADFSSATVVTGGTLSGDVITFTGVDLEDGQYFTLGTNFFECSPGGIEDNLTIWLRADQGTNTTVNGAEVTSWTNQGGSSTITGSGGTSPTFVENDMNFNPGLDFDGTEFLVGTAGLYSTGYYLVINPDNAISSAATLEVPLSFDATSSGSTTNLGLFGLGNVAGGLDERVSHLLGFDAPTLYLRSETDNVKSTAAGTALLYHVRNNSGGTESNISENGLQIDNATNAGSFLSVTNEEFEIGRERANAGFNFNGQIAEVISYSVRPTDAENERIESYLSVKYGITLDNSGGGTDGDYTSGQNTTIWDASDYSTYHNDVAGIGRDDVSCFQQKQSKSSNSGSIVTIGLGGIEATNAANANTFTTDDTYMMWGNDGDLTDQANANTSDVPGIVTERMERIWRINETNTVGATTVQFDITGLGYSTNVSDFNLIVSSTATMGSGTITPAASLVGNILTFTGVDFADGDFFTIGTARTNCGPGGVTTNLELWLRADSEVFNTGTTSATDGQTIATWADQSASAADATDPDNRTTFETNTINFNPAVQFNNDATSLEGTFTTSIAGMTLISAALIDGTSGTTDALFEVATGADQNNRGYFAEQRFGGTTTFASPLNNDVWGIFSVDRPSGSNADIYQNGALFENNYNPSSFAAATGSYRYTLGDDDTGGNEFIGFLGDVIAYQGTISSTQRQQVETYLAIKYGVTIDQTSATDYIWSDGSTVIWNGTTNATYNNDIAGIGRDDASCFSQKQSKSGNSDAILSIGLAEVAASNAENTNAFTDNGDYLIWGNDNGSTAEGSKETSDVPNSISERMTRVWKVEDTGEVGETELQFDLTGTGFSVADATAFSLLVGSTATMADATIITGGTLNGNVLSFTGIDLTDGQFFTIGTGITICGPGGVNTSIAMWVKADAEVFSDNPGTTAATDGDNALFWNDQGAQGLNMEEDDLGGGINAIEPTFETSEINFNPVVNFTDPGSANNSYIRTDDAFSVPAGTAQDDFTLISVFKTGQASGTANDNVNSPVLISSRSGSGLDNAMGMDNGTIWVNADSDAAFEAETTSTFNNNSVHIATSIRDQSEGNLNLYVDANEEVTATGITTSLTNADGGFGIGNHFTTDVDAQYAGDIAETIVYNQVLDSDQRNRVESYLAIKYGITLNGADDVTTMSVDERDYRAGDGGVIWDYSDKTTYSNDIFGVGKDDLSCLDQTQSKSENSDAIVTINNTGGFSVDDSWLVSGNDNAAIEATRNPERPATINSRLNREWQVQETGTVGTVELTFDLSNVTGTESGSNNLTQTRLMVDDDGNFGNGGTTLISPSATNGGSQTVTFQVDFTDGQFYTLGSIENDALPITLISFEVNNYKDDQVKLDWVTASEVNNAFYTIERSTDGVNFESVANLDGAGNSSDLLYYSFVDANPLNGTSFYRLKQTDFSGEFDYSEIRSVKIEKQVEASFRAYPNPVVQGESLSINYAVDSDQVLSLTILSNTGQVLYRQEQQVYAAQQSFQIQTNKMKKGLNLLRILDANSRTKILKILVK